MKRALMRAGFLAMIGSFVDAGPRAEAGLAGFSNFSLNQTVGGQPGGGFAMISPDNSTLTLTNGQGSEASSAFYQTAQAISGPSSTGFQAQFIYQGVTPPNVGAGDGVTFTLQNDPAGTAALGFGGGGLGYGGITNSSAIQLNIFQGFFNEPGTGPGTTLNFGGLTAQNGGNSYIGTAPVDLTSGDPILVTLNYDAASTTLTETLKDLTTLATFTTSYVEDLAIDVGGPTAFVGFTGGTGAAASTQTISDFTFTSNVAVPEPSTIVSLGLGLIMAAGAMHRRRLARPSA